MLCDEKKCTGCGACANACPKGCIEMKLNEKGYLLPHINSECINCNVCENACPNINKTNRQNRIFPRVYLAHANNESILKNTTSGGIATVLNRRYTKGGHSCGVVFTDSFLANYKMADSPEQTNDFACSKYVQSNTCNIYKEVKEKLENNKPVFFCGLPCQVAGLHSYLGKEYENLLTADIVCHGTSSSKIFQEYIKHMEQTFHSKIKSICHTSKKKGWNILISKLICIKTENGNAYYYDSKKDSYLHLFLSNIMFKPACYNCTYQVMPRIGDLTLGDFFGIGTIYPVKKLNSYGESMVLVNTQKGIDALNKIKDEIYLEERKLEEALYFNHNLWRSSKPHPKREAFENDINCLSYEALSKKYYSKSIYSRLNRTAREFLKRILGARLVAKCMLFTYKRTGIIQKADNVIAQLQKNLN